MTVTIKITRNQFPDIARKLPIAAASIVGKRGQEMVEIAQQRSRVDTGRMRAGWEFRTRGRGGSGSLTNEVPYTVHNEYGTYKMASQAMARPAFEQVAPKIISDLKDLERHLA